MQEEFRQARQWARAHLQGSELSQQAGDTVLALAHGKNVMWQELAQLLAELLASNATDAAPLAKYVLARYARMSENAQAELAARFVG